MVVKTITPVFLALVLLAGASAKAGELIYTNLGPGGSFDQSIGFTISGMNSLSITGFGEPANSFTPLDDFTITTIDVALGWISGTNQIVLSLENSDASGVPDQVLQSWDISAPSGFGSTVLVEVTSDSVEVQAGKQYWLVAAPGNSTTFAAWNFNDQGDVGPELTNQGTGWHGADGTLGAFQVSGVRGNTVPEIDPGSAASAMTMLAGALLVIRGRRKKPL